jgi:hypothetical protein
MIKGDILADIFDSPETIAQARREGYALVDPADIKKLGDDLEQLTKSELLELTRQMGIFKSSIVPKKKDEIIDLIKAARSAETNPEKPEGSETPGELKTEEPKNESSGSENPVEPEQSPTPEQAPAEPEAGKKKHGIFG